MAIVSAYNETGLTVFAVIRDSALKFADVVAQALEDYDAGSIGDYDIPANEIGATGEYHVTWPSWLVAGLYTIQFAPQAGGSPAVSDLPNRFAVQSYYWDGVSLVPDWAVKLARSAAPVAGSMEVNLDEKSSDILAQVDEYPVLVTPLAATVSAGEVSANKLVAYQHHALGPFVWAIVDDTGAAVDLTEKDVRFNVAEIGSEAAPAWSYSSTGAEIVVGSTSGNRVTLAADDEHTARAGLYQYRLVNFTDDAVLNTGTLRIVPGVASSSS